ncbi:MAG: hypothetical protein V3U82_00905 [Robiginitomaculum sp.]
MKPLTSVKTVEMLIEPGAEALIIAMGKKMKTRARSKVIDRAVTHIRDNDHSSDVMAWFSELRFAPSRRTTVRLSPANADYLNTLAQTLGRGRPAILLDMVYYAAANLQAEDFEAMG